LPMPTQELSTAKWSPNPPDELLLREQLRVPSTEQLLLFHGPELFASVVTISPVGHVVVSIDGRILRANDVFCQLTGFTADAILGTLLETIITPKTRADTDEMLGRLLKRRETAVEWSASFLQPSGREITLTLNGVVVSESGRPRYITILTRSVTQLASATPSSHDLSDTFRALVERIPAVTYVTTLEDNGGTLYISPQITGLLGYQQEEWLSRRSVWREIVHPEDREAVLEAIRRGRDERTGFRLEYRVVSRDGRICWIRNEAALMPDESSAVPHWHGVMYDITERKKLEERLGS